MSGVDEMDRLPSFAPSVLFVGEPKRADAVWTKKEFIELCSYMMNGNPPNHFMMTYRDSTTGKPKFAKAKTQKMAARASWAWDSIGGRAKSPAGIGFYPSNDSGMSRWGAMDFDAHDGNGARARDLALAAFQLLYQLPQCRVILATSGSDGWHLFIFWDRFLPVEEWTRCLRDLASLIKVEIRPGICEIFPAETRGTTGYGIRAPGTYNPKYETFGGILFQNVVDLLPRRGKREYPSLYRETNGKKKVQFPDSENAPYFEGNNNEWRVQFAITQPQTRRNQLKALASHVFRQVGREVGMLNAQSQYTQAKVLMEASAEEHLAEFRDLWAWMEKQWIEELSEGERQVFGSLTTDNERDAFRIVRGFAQLADEKGNMDFPIARESVARRLGITPPGVAKIRDKLVRLQAMKLTAEHVQNVSAKRFQWLLRTKEEHPF